MNALTRRLVARLGVLLAALALSPFANAILPESGFYWVKGESGRGFTLEMQQNLLFLATYTFTESGVPIWYVAGGPMTSDRDWEADVSEVTGGTSFDKGFRAVTSKTVGKARLAFSDESTATLTFLGTPLTISRFEFAFDSSAAGPDILLGEWAVSRVEGDQFGRYGGDRLAFGAVRPQPPLNVPTAVGLRLGSPTQTVLAVRDSASGRYFVVVDEGDGTLTRYEFKLTGVMKAEGSWVRYAATASPIPAATRPFVAFRTAAVQSLLGARSSAPATEKRAVAEPDLTRLAEHLAALLVANGSR